MSTTFARMCIAAAICAAALASQRDALSTEPPSRASQENRGEQFPFTFRFDAAALATEKGTRRVYLELKRQATRACTVAAPSSTRIHSAERQCAEELMSAVVQRIASQALTAQLAYRR